MLRSLSMLTLPTIFALQEPTEPFEGSLEIREVEGTEETLRRYDFKEGKVRIENIKEKDSVVVLDWDAKRFLLLMPEEKVYMEMSGKVQDLLTLSASSQKKRASGPKPIVTTPPSQEKIAEAPCNLWKIPEYGSQGPVELQMAEGFGSHAARFIALARFHANDKKKDPFAFGAWEKIAIEKKTFPFRMVEKNRSGKELRRMEVLKLERKSLPDSHFQTPKDYTGMTVDVGDKKGKN